jgi:hypothetical protein
VLIYTEGQTDAQEDEAKDLINLLSIAYPGHPWAVRVGDGFIFVRYLDEIWESKCRGPVGYKVNAEKSFSASDLKKAVVTAGGQLLEMMYLKRGRSNGDEPETIDGIPDRFAKKVQIA